MGKAWKAISPRQRKFSIGRILQQLILIGLVTTTAWAQRQNKPEDLFVVQHRQALQKNPEGISFTVRINKDKLQFKPGEIIPVEYSFTNNLPNTTLLLGGISTCGGRSNLDKFFLDQKKGVVDPQGDYLYPGYDIKVYNRALCDPWSHTMKVAEPNVITLELNEWFRFDQPGKFRLYVTAPRIRQNRESWVGDGMEVTSNIVEFEILPRDPQWEEQELEKIKKLLGASEHTEKSTDACRRMRFLNSEAAAEEMVGRYSGMNTECDLQYLFGLIGSPHRAFVIKKMERKLNAPDQKISTSYLRTLSYLAARLHQKEPLPAIQPKDPQQAEVADNAWRSRTATTKQLLVQYAERLASVLSAKEGEARAVGLVTILEIVDDRTIRDEDSVIRIAALVHKITPEIITYFNRSPDKQVQLLRYRWKRIGSSAWLPVLRRIVNEPLGSDRSSLPEERKALALRRIYELSPEEGRRLIIEDARRPNPWGGLTALHLLPDETLPELDEVLVDNIEKAGSESREGPELLCGLIERYASAAVASRVEKFYSDQDGRWGCSVQSSLLAYLLRVKSQVGIELVKKSLAARSAEPTRCYTRLLSEVAKLHTTPLLEAIAIEHLNDSDPEVVLDAVRMLGRYGSAEAEKPLWERLEKWHQEWKGREKDLPKPLDTKHSNHWQKALGASLQHALSYSPAWVINREKLERLRQSFFDKDELQQFNEQVREWGNQVEITFRPGDDWLGDNLWGGASVAHYWCNSISDLRAKLSQFPKGTVFIWRAEGQSRRKAEQAFSEVKAVIENLGLKMERRKDQ